MYDELGFPMPPLEAFRPEAGRMRLFKKGSQSAPPPDPRLFEVMDKQVATGDRLVEFIKSSWEDNKGRMADQDVLNKQAIEQNMRLAQSAEDRSNDAYNFYKQEGRPVISQALKDAQEWDSESNIQRAQQAARTDQQMAFDAAQQQQGRTLARMGVNPNSTKFAALNNALMMQKAASTAGAVSQAGEQRRSQGAAMRQQAGNLASGMPAQSMGFAGQASGFGGAASGIGGSGINQALAMQNSAQSGMSAAGNQFGSAAGQYNQLYGQQSQNWATQQQQKSDSMAGIGQIAGMAMAFMAEGGKVEGPGSGISDSVPAINRDSGQRIQLSNGEYVIPADVVRKVGEDKFDRLLAKYHTPVAQQRRGNLSRRA